MNKQSVKHMQSILKQVSKLNNSEKILLAEAILESLDQKHEPEISKQHISMLEEALVNYEKNPASASDWDIAKQRIVSQL